MSLQTIRDTLAYANKDSRLHGIAFVMPKLSAGWTVCAGLREEILHAAAAGKKTAILATHGGGNREVYVASAAQQVFTPPQATWMPIGLASRANYVRPLLAKLGVEVEPFARKEYKTAAERLTRDAMSGPQREQSTAILNNHQDTLTRALADRFSGTEDAVVRAEAIFERGFVSAKDALGLGLVNGLGYEDELATLLGLPSPNGPENNPKNTRRRRRAKGPFVEAGRYLAYKRRRLWLPLRKAPYMAVVSIKGAIGEGGSPSGRRETIVSALRRVRRDKRAKGLLLWVDSPGGSAEASDLIHREVKRVRDRKPVVAYFGDVAASGGYYVSAHANQIVAHPLTLTGSIGVVSARFVTSVLADKLGVRAEVLKTTPHADIFSSHRALTDDERAMFDRHLDDFYGAFVGIVADGRGRPAQDVEPLARGRVWSGRAAMDNGLVDQLGTMGRALEVLREQIALTTERRPVRRLKPVLVQPTPLAPAPTPVSRASVAEPLWDRALSQIANASTASLLEALFRGESVLYSAWDLPHVD